MIYVPPSKKQEKEYIEHKKKAEKFYKGIAAGNLAVITIFERRICT